MFTFSILFTACLKSPPVSVPSEIVNTHKVQVDGLGNELVDNGWMTALSIGLIHPNGVEFYNYGSHSKETQRLPSEHSIYEIGSISKVFTGLLVADLVSQKKIKLDAPLTEWTLKDWPIPSKDGVEISASHLVSHSSGLPRLPYGFAPTDFQNPYVDFTVDDLRAALTDIPMPMKPGENVVYSNLGSGLLGYGLTQYSGLSYDEMIQQTICSPLGLDSTFVDVPTSQKSRTVQGYDMAGEPISDWDMPVLVGMGEINSTVFDLVQFAKAQLYPPKSALGQAIRMSHKSLIARDDDVVAMGWHIGIRDNPNLIWHSGGTGGARSFIAFHPENKIGVVVLSTNTSPFVTGTVRSLLNILRGEPANLKLPQVVSLTEQQLRSFEGEYEISEAITLSFSPKDGLLLGELPKMPPILVYPTSPNIFESIHVPLKFEFQRNEQGDVFQLLMHEGNKTTTIKKQRPQVESPHLKSE